MEKELEQVFFDYTPEQFVYKFYQTEKVLQIEVYGDVIDARELDVVKANTLDYEDFEGEKFSAQIENSEDLKGEFSDKFRSFFKKGFSDEFKNWINEVEKEEIKDEKTDEIEQKMIDDVDGKYGEEIYSEILKHADNVHFEVHFEYLKAIHKDKYGED